MKMKAQISMKLILIGLLSQIDFSHSRAVNISNTWTLPQAGFNVFYRYFRDKISWFEADAVCQFHHANLVTVENIEQFDATRLFLKELDIPDFVWIGLMRPSNTDQFSWTNSKPLPVSEGYWAEPWPVAETPLCAVIDPSRDYRWHALRCGGPETAAFLCEMEIPDWAIHCTENTDVTVQYISDSGAVQVSRRCKDSLKEISCQPKENQMDVNNALKCPEDDDEEMSSSTTTVNAVTENTVEASKLSSTEVTFVTTAAATTVEEIQPRVIIKNPQKMMEDIFDTIDVNVEVDSNRLDESNPQKMDLDLMVGDQPLTDDSTEDKKIILKQQEKKEIYPKKSAKMMKEKLTKVSKDEEEQMMGDAPAEEEVHSTESNADISTSTFAVTTERQRRDANLIEASTDASSSTITDTSITSSTAEESSSISTELSSPTTTAEQIITTPVTEETTTKIIVHGHPLHMSQAIFKEPIQPDVNGTHERIDFGDAEDRFIPPMLLVKAKFTTTTSSGEIATTTKGEQSTTDIATSSLSTEQSTISDVSDNADESGSTATPKVDSNEIPLNDTTAAITQLENTISTVAASEKPIMVGKRNDPRLGLNAVTTTTSTTTTMPPSSTTDIFITTEIPLSSTTVTTDAEEELTSIADESSSSSSSGSTFEITTDNSLSSSSTSPLMTDESETSSVSEIATTTLQTHASAEKLIDVSTTTIISSPQPLPIAIKLSTSLPSSSSPSPKTTTAMRNDINAYHQPADDSHDLLHNNEDDEDEDSDEEHNHHHVDNNFSNAENYQPYKPNRHRTLSKSDHHHGPGFSLGKILG